MVFNKQKSLPIPRRFDLSAKRGKAMGRPLLACDFSYCRRNSIQLEAYGCGDGTPHRIPGRVFCRAESILIGRAPSGAIHLIVPRRIHDLGALHTAVRRDNEA